MLNVKFLLTFNLSSDSLFSLLLKGITLFEVRFWLNPERFCGLVERVFGGFNYFIGYKLKLWQEGSKAV